MEVNPNVGELIQDLRNRLPSEDVGTKEDEAIGVIERARRDLLVAALARETVTYGHLMKKFGVSRGRPLSRLISQLDAAESSRGAPGFAAIIVRRDTGFPGGGYFCDDGLPAALRRSPSRATDPRLSPAEAAHVRAEQNRIWAFYGVLP